MSFLILKRHEKIMNSILLTAEQIKKSLYVYYIITHFFLLMFMLDECLSPTYYFNLLRWAFNYLASLVEIKNFKVWSESNFVICSIFQWSLENDLGSGIWSRLLFVRRQSNFSINFWTILFHMEQKVPIQQRVFVAKYFSKNIQLFK